jgi:hypothetical protein
MIRAINLIDAKRINRIKTGKCSGRTASENGCAVFVKKLTAVGADVRRLM